MINIANKKIRLSKTFYPKNLLRNYSKISSNIYSKWVKGKKHMKDNGYPLHEPYQTKALYWFLRNEEHPKFIGGGILADDMGLGKTIQSLSIIAANPKNEPTLIVLPSGLIQQWIDVIKTIFPKKTICLHYGPNRAKRSLDTALTVKQQRLLKSDIVITSHNLVFTRTPKDQQKLFVPTVLHDIKWSRVIVDESHFMRNISSLKTQGIITLQSSYKWALTGTPIQNKLTDLLTQFRFVGFKLNELKDPIKLDKIKKRYLLRRTKKQLKIFNPKLALPPPIIKDVVVGFSNKKERIFYRKVEKNVAEEFKKIISGSLDNREQMVLIFELLLRLRQAAISPQLVLDGYRKKGLFKKKKWFKNKIPTKYKLLLQHLRKLRKTHPTDRSIVFTHFTQEIQDIHALLTKHKIQANIIDGKTSSKRRQYILTHPPKVLLIQIKAGNVGLNLQQYNRIFFTSPDWNPANELQAIARAHRLGQTKLVTVTRFRLKDTIDTRIHDTQRNKLDLIDEHIKISKHSKQLVRYTHNKKHTLQKLLNPHHITTR